MSDREKRCEERYDLELPVMVKWQDGGGRTREAPGTARNISPLGAFLVCVSPIGQGCAVDLDFDDPLDLGGCIPSRISATATVLRDAGQAEHVEGYGHGIMFERFSFTRLQGP
ncbi:MAG: hypothetical protein JRE24_11270 [Deltaproteobacteria bacterium]|jgi:hypothetical protein|nr:hypothetical protein [Deltaproteobacteria bacterium]MBW2567428.1 hypothetical protein [Deltaproteobacteria bacterium]